MESANQKKAKKVVKELMELGFSNDGEGPHMIYEGVGDNNDIKVHFKQILENPEELKSAVIDRLCDIKDIEVVD